MGTRELINSVFRVIFPRKCIFCDEIINIESDQWVCESCKLPFLTHNLCEKCGKPLQEHHFNLCFDCRKQRHSYTEGRALWPYDEGLKRGIRRYKYEHQKNYYVYFAEQMIDFYIHQVNWRIDLITSVPLHDKRYRVRGYNQAALLATALGKGLDIAVDNELLRRVKDTIPQSKLSDQQRVNNLKYVMEMGKNVNLKSKHILIIDDIYTTGSTIEACSQILLEQGACKVYFMVLAIGRGY